MGAYVALALTAVGPIVLGVALIVAARRLGRTPDPLRTVMAEHRVTDGGVQ